MRRLHAIEGIGRLNALAGILGSVAAMPMLITGFVPSKSAGSSANLFVSNDGDDGNAGTLSAPFATIQAAADVAASGDTIAVRGGTYRESVILPENIHLKRYGAERVVISGQDALTGWATCVAGDAALLGDAWESCFKVTLPLTSFSGGHPGSAWLHEAGDPLYLALDWLGDPQSHFHADRRQFRQTASPVLMADPVPNTVARDTWFLGLTNPDFFSGYTQAQIAQMEVNFIHYPNQPGRVPIESFDAATGTIYFEGADPTTGYDGALVEYHYNTSNTAYRDAFSLLNVLPKISQGGWGWEINGTDATLYIWPNEAANVTANVSIAKRGRGVTPATGCTIEGIEFNGHGSSLGSQAGDYPIHAKGASLMSDMTVRNVAVRNYYNSDGFGYGALWFNDQDDLLVDGLTVQNVYGSSAFFLQGARRAFVKNVIVENIEKTPMRCFTAKQSILSRCRVINSGLAAHSNKSNDYEGGDQFVWHACDFSGASGYLTWQETSQVALVNCIIPGSYEDGRAVVDQNKPTTLSPADQGSYSGASYLIGVEAIQYPLASVPDRSNVILGEAANAQVTFSVLGSIYHGVEQAYVGAVTSSFGNVNTQGDEVLPGDTLIDTSDVYEDPLAGDWRIKSTSAIRALDTIDVSTQIAAIKTWVPFVSDEEFDIDLNGNPVDWFARVPGARATLDTEARFPSLIVKAPVISGAPSVDAALAPSQPFIVGAPRLAITYLWQRSLDLVTWSDITAATSLAYTPLEADEGYALRLLTFAGDKTSISYAPSSVAGLVAVVSSVTRSATADSYLIGPNLPAGTKALTVKMILDIGEGFGSTTPFDWQSGTFEVRVDSDAPDRYFTGIAEQSSGTQVFGFQASADGTFPTGKHTLLTSVTLDQDGLGAAKLKLWIDGVLITDRTAVSPAGGSAVFSANRPLEVLEGLYGGTFEEFTAWIGYTDDGDTTGLTLLHSVSGGADEWNNPGTGLVKAGTDLFVDTP